MKILFISDLHLGSPLFKSKFIIFKLLSDKSYDKIVIVGDIIDTWEDTIDNIITNNKVLINKINSLSNVVVIKGNHDPSYEELRIIFPKAELIDYREPYKYENIIITHGDDFDVLVTKYSFLAKLLYPIYWACERIGIDINSKIRNTLHSIACHREKKYYNDLVMDVEDNLVAKYIGKCKYLVAGHTHLPKFVSARDITYINCGDWTYNKTYVEYIDGSFVLRKENGDDYFK